jgi:predicted dehydrogenase
MAEQTERSTGLSKKTVRGVKQSTLLFVRHSISMPMRRTKLNIGLIGAGSIVRERHLPALKKIDDVRIVAVCNSTYESSEKFCSEHVPDAKPYSNWAELVAEPDINIVWIGTPPYLHSTIAISALEAGKNVFCQARMAMTLAEAEEMVAAVQRHPHLVTMLCPAPRGLRGSRFMQKLIADEYLGRPHHLRLQSLSSNYIDPETPPHWRQRDEYSGLNVLTLGIYAEVLSRWFGPIARLIAHEKTITPVRQGYEIRIPDMVTVLCTFASGLEGVLEFSGIAPFAKPDRLEVYGNLGKLEYDFPTDEILGAQLGDEASVHLPIPAHLEQSWNVEADFIAAVRSPSGISPQPGFGEGLQYMKVVQAVADSIAQHREIELL